MNHNEFASSPTNATVYFDQNCDLCRLLADFMQRAVDPKQLSFAGGEENISAIYVVASDRTYTGNEAWTWLLLHHPRLSTLRWLAVKLNLTEATSHTMARGAHMLRRFCRNCKHA